MTNVEIAIVVWVVLALIVGIVVGRYIAAGRKQMPPPPEMEAPPGDTDEP